MRSSPTQRVELLVVFTVLTMTLLSYAGSLGHGFVNWDDPEHIFNNPAIEAAAGGDWGAMWASTVNKIYVPLTTLSFALEHKLFGWNAFVLHLDNLLLHLLVTGLVFVLGRRWGLNSLAAGAAALLFGLHPMHVESVAWLTERKDVLYSALYLLALCSYGCYRGARPDSLPQARREWFWLTVILGLLSLLAKPMALSLPLVLLLVDVFEGRRLSFRLWGEKILFALVFAPVVWVTLRGNLRTADSGLLEGGLIWIWSLTFYLQKLLWPATLLPVYPVPDPVAATTPEYAGALVTAAVCAVALWRWRRVRWIGFAFGWYACSIFFLLRTDPDLDAHVVADRFMYLPSLGFCLLFGWVAAGVMSKLQARGMAVRAGYGLIMVLIFAALGMKTAGQVRIWRDSLTVWQYVTARVPQSAKAWHNLGSGFADRGEWERALEYYDRALTLDPGLPLTHYNRAVALARTGREPEAREAYERYEYYQQHGTPRWSWTR